MLKEFKEFAMRGNVMDMAIGIVLGGAFGKIVSSFVNDVLMPVIGKLLGGVDFTSLFLNLTGTEYDTIQAAEEANAAIMKYGNFFQTVVDFVIIAFAIFMVVKAMNRLQTKEEVEEAPTTKKCPRCVSAIPIDATRCPNCTSDV